MLRFEPPRDLDSISSAMLGTSSGSDRAPLSMPMDLYKLDGHYVLNADLPGVNPGSIDVDRGTLTLSQNFVPAAMVQVRIPVFAPALPPGLSPVVRKYRRVRFPVCRGYPAGV